MTPTWTIQAVLDKGIQALGHEVERLAGMPALDSFEGKQLADYIKAAVLLAKEEREAAAAAKVGKADERKLGALILDELARNPELRREVEVMLRAQARAS